VLEYPEDPVALGPDTQYEYLLGTSILVAPVYKSEAKRDSIYFPAGSWIDYWDGKLFKGNQWISNYSAPLDKLPLFVKAGSIIPMYQEMAYDWERPTDTLTLDIYPEGKAAFEMYEDDGLTREHRQGVYAITRFEVNDNAAKGLDIRILPANGDFKGRLKQRVYILEVHTADLPKEVRIQGEKIKPDSSKRKSAAGTWSFDPNDRGGVLRITTGWIATDAPTAIGIL
jgi:alpha-glucosidase (family GH31 glycosyl hydrolase)